MKLYTCQEAFDEMVAGYIHAMENEDRAAYWGERVGLVKVALTNIRERVEASSNIEELGNALREVTKGTWGYFDQWADHKCRCDECKKFYRIVIHIADEGDGYDCMECGSRGYRVLCLECLREAVSLLEVNDESPS